MPFHELKALYAQNARLDGAHHTTALTSAGAALDASWADAGRAARPARAAAPAPGAPGAPRPRPDPTAAATAGPSSSTQSRRTKVATGRRSGTPKASAARKRKAAVSSLQHGAQSPALALAGIRKPAARRADSLATWARGGDARESLVDQLVTDEAAEAVAASHQAASTTAPVVQPEPPAAPQPEPPAAPQLAPAPAPAPAGAAMAPFALAAAPASALIVAPPPTSYLPAGGWEGVPNLGGQISALPNPSQEQVGMLLYAKPQLVIQYAKARDACPNRSVHPQFWKATLAKFDVQLYGQHAPGQRVLVTAHDAGSLVQLTNADLMATHPDKPPRSIFTQRRLAAGVAPIREESRVVALNACGQSKVNVYFGFTSSQVIANNNSALAVVLRAQLISDDPNAAPVLAYSQQFTINARSQTKAEKDLGAARNLLELPAGANARMAPNAPVAVATVVGPPPPSPPPPPGAAGPSQCAAPRGAHPSLAT